MDYANLAILIVCVLAALIVGRYGWRSKGAVDDDGVIEHVRIRTTDEFKQWHRERLAEAAARHGKAFKAGPYGKDIPHEQTHRQEPRSRDLMDIDAASKREKEAAKLAGTIENITRIERKMR